MKKLVVGIVSIGALALPASAAAQGAVKTEGLCGNETGQLVTTPSGNANFNCHTEGPRTGQTVNFKLPCFIGGVGTAHYVYTKSGQVQFGCHVNP